MDHKHLYETGFATSRLKEVNDVIVMYLTKQVSARMSLALVSINIVQARAASFLHERF